MELATILTVVTLVFLVLSFFYGPKEYRLWLMTAFGAIGAVMVIALVILVSS